MSASDSNFFIVGKASPGKPLMQGALSDQAVTHVFEPALVSARTGAESFYDALRLTDAGCALIRASKRA